MTVDRRSVPVRDYPYGPEEALTKVNEDASRFGETMVRMARPEGLVQRKLQVRRRTGPGVPSSLSYGRSNSTFNEPSQSVMSYAKLK